MWVKSLGWTEKLLDSKAVKNTQAINLENQIFSNQAEMEPNSECNLQRLNKQPSVKEIENLAEFGGGGERRVNWRLKIEEIGSWRDEMKSKTLSFIYYL